MLLTLFPSTVAFFSAESILGRDGCVPLHRAKEGSDLGVVVAVVVVVALDPESRAEATTAADMVGKVLMLFEYNEIPSLALGTWATGQPKTSVCRPTFLKTNGSSSPVQSQRESEIHSTVFF